MPRLRRARRSTDSTHAGPERSPSASLSPSAFALRHSGIVSESPSAPRQAPECNDGNGLSDFAARVLGQLSLSAWLPAALLTVVLVLLLQFRTQGRIELGLAVDALARDKWKLVILTVPVLVLMTLVTQAFSFEAIRILEGYWRRPLALPVRSALIRLQLARKHRLHDSRIRLSHEAFLASRGRWRDHFPSTVVDALEQDSREADLTDEEQALIGELDWSRHCDPWRMARIEHLETAEEQYPEDSRILPTRLGNLIRATEDGLSNADDDVEGFALRRRASAPERVRQQHDQFRTRLDMYAVLFFVAVLLSILTPALLLCRVPDHQKAWVAWMSASFGALAVASYLAAIASAGGYLTALRLLDKDSASLPDTGSVPETPEGAH